MNNHNFVFIGGLHRSGHHCYLSVLVTIRRTRVKPLRSYLLSYLWFDTGDNQWHLRAVASELSLCGGVLSTPGSIREAVPVFLGDWLVLWNPNMDGSYTI